MIYIDPKATSSVAIDWNGPMPFDFMDDVKPVSQASSSSSMDGSKVEVIKSSKVNKVDVVKNLIQTFLENIQGIKHQEYFEKDLRKSLEELEFKDVQNLMYMNLSLMTVEAKIAPIYEHLSQEQIKQIAEKLTNDSCFLYAAKAAFRIKDYNLRNELLKPIIDGIVASQDTKTLCSVVHFHESYAQGNLKRSIIEKLKNNLEFDYAAELVCDSGFKLNHTDFLEKMLIRDLSSSAEKNGNIGAVLKLISSVADKKERDEKYYDVFEKLLRKEDYQQAKVVIEKFSNKPMKTKAEKLIKEKTALCSDDLDELYDALCKLPKGFDRVGRLQKVIKDLIQKKNFIESLRFIAKSEYSKNIYMIEIAESFMQDFDFDAVKEFVKNITDGESRNYFCSAIIEEIFSKTKNIAQIEEIAEFYTSKQQKKEVLEDINIKSLCFDKKFDEAIEIVNKIGNKTKKFEGLYKLAELMLSLDALDKAVEVMQILPQSHQKNNFLMKNSALGEKYHEAITNESKSAAADEPPAKKRKI